MSRGVQFSDDQIAEFQEAFLLYDNRGDGKISVNLIGDVMRALGQNPTESDVKKLVHEYRADGRVSFETFLPILQVTNLIPVHLLWLISLHLFQKWLHIPTFKLRKLYEVYDRDPGTIFMHQVIISFVYDVPYS